MNLTRRVESSRCRAYRITPQQEREAMPKRLLIGVVAMIALWNLSLAQTGQITQTNNGDPGANLKDFQAIEFRRYTIKTGQRQNFEKYFDTYFPDAFQQQGAIVAGSFLERTNSNGFTWIRGFHTLDARAVQVNPYEFLRSRNEPATMAPCCWK